MPVFNEEERVGEAVKQALAVEYPCDVELVVVDDGSRDGTPEILGGHDDLRSLDIRSHGFGMEAELTGKLLRRRIRPYEVPISYRARNREDGKKITWRDGVEALWILGRERTRRLR